jgi:hypothetical protein
LLADLLCVSMGLANATGRLVGLSHCQHCHGRGRAVGFPGVDPDSGGGCHRSGDLRPGSDIIGPGPDIDGPNGGRFKRF